MTERWREWSKRTEEEEEARREEERREACGIEGGELSEEERVIVRDLVWKRERGGVRRGKVDWEEAIGASSQLELGSFPSSTTSELTFDS